MPGSPRTRVLTPYERTHLRRFGKSEDLTALGSMPVEYFTGKVEFNNLVLNVTSDVLIPRVETERLAQLALEEAEKLIANQRPIGVRPFVIADVGTGCGAVIIYVASQLRKHHPGMTFAFLASDISPAAIEVAIRNADQVVPDADLQFFTSDLLCEFPQMSIDLLIANLPYIPSSRIPVLDESVKDHEPHLALDGGEDGLDLIHKLLGTAPTFLQPHATVLLEIDYTHTVDAFAQHCHQWRIEVFVDDFSRNRFARCQRI